MKISLLKEIKPQEGRVGLTPANVAELVDKGHEVFVEKDAGLLSGFADEAYVSAGATLVDAKTGWDEADLVVKIKEPIAEEYKYFREGLMIYTYFHLASNEPLTKALVDNKVTAIAYETVEMPDGSLPLLTPMSEIAGRMSIQVAANISEKPNGGNGILLSGITGVAPGKIVIIGGGVVGLNAAQMATGMQAEVVIFELNEERIKSLQTTFGDKARVLKADEATIKEELATADVLVGAVLIPGGVAPKVVTKAMVQSMKPGSVIVDVAIDQGGSVETIDHYTTHDSPTYIVENVIHYAVANMPGAVPRTATIGITNATAKYAYAIADMGYKAAMEKYPELAKGLNTENGKITYDKVQEAFPNL